MLGPARWCLFFWWDVKFFRIVKNWVDVLINTSAPSHQLNSVAWPVRPVLSFRDIPDWLLNLLLFRRSRCRRCLRIIRSLSCLRRALSDLKHLSIVLEPGGHYWGHWNGLAVGCYNLCHHSALLFHLLQIITCSMERCIKRMMHHWFVLRMEVLERFRVGSRLRQMTNVNFSVPRDQVFPCALLFNTSTPRLVASC